MIFMVGPTNKKDVIVYELVEGLSECQIPYITNIA